MRTCFPKSPVNVIGTDVGIIDRLKYIIVTASTMETELPL